MNLKILFRHYHDGNDPWEPRDPSNPKSRLQRVRGDAIYATRAALVDIDSGDVLKEAWAFCGPADSPTRKKGREITFGRLQLQIVQDAATYSHEEWTRVLDAINDVKLPKERRSHLALFI